jgi:hypothetical protein
VLQVDSTGLHIPGVLLHGHHLPQVYQLPLKQRPVCVHVLQLSVFQRPGQHPCLGVMCHLRSSTCAPSMQQSTGTRCMSAASAATRCLLACALGDWLTVQVAPWSKTGGLGDVIGSLPIALAARGHRVMVVAPRYGIYPEAFDMGVGGTNVRQAWQGGQGCQRTGLAGLQAAAPAQGQPCWW